MATRRNILAAGMVALAPAVVRAQASPTATPTVMHRLADRMVAGDLDGVEALFAPDAVVYPVGEPAGRRFRLFAAAWNGAYVDGTADVDAVADAEGSASGAIRLTGTMMGRFIETEPTQQAERVTALMLLRTANDELVHTAWLLVYQEPTD